MTTIYHYTDINGFFNIVTQKKIWLSGPHNLNDHQELHWAYRKIEDTFARQEGKFKPEHLQSLWQLIHINKIVPFTCSLSSDGDLLSQWRAYAKDGVGVAIGFNSDLLPNTGSLPHYTAAVQNSITTLKVQYNEDIQDSTIEHIVVSTLESMSNNEKLQPEIFTIDASHKLNGLATIYKNSAFREECEWRIIHTPIITGNINSNITSVNAGISELKHRVSNDKLISYFEYDFAELISKGIITDLILGPKCVVKSYDLELFLTTRGLERLNITQSSATYR